MVSVYPPDDVEVPIDEDCWTEVRSFLLGSGCLSTDAQTYFSDVVYYGRISLEILNLALKFHSSNTRLAVMLLTEGARPQGFQLEDHIVLEFVESMQYVYMDKSESDFDWMCLDSKPLLREKIWKFLSNNTSPQDEYEEFGKYTDHLYNVLKN